MTNPDNVGGLNDHKPVPLSEELRIEAALQEHGAAKIRLVCMAQQAERLEELCRAAPAGGDGLRLLVKELRESLEGVVRVADRQTDEFDRAREAIARAAHLFVNAGDSEAQFIADGENLDCPTCGGSGHAGDSAPAGSGEVASIVTRIERILKDSEAGHVTGLGDTCEDALNSAIELLRKLQQGADGETCEWSKDDEEWEGPHWESSCGETYFFTEGAPADNGHKFCHGCGKPLVIASQDQDGV